MKNFMRFLCAAMLCVSFAACDPEDMFNVDGDNNNYSTLILGTWQVDLMSANGLDMTPPNMQISFYENGSGLMNDGGVTDHNNFTWAINGSIVNVTTDKYQFAFTIDSITATECAFHGYFIEMDGYEISGDIRFHMTKAGGTPGGDPDPSDTNWVDLGLPSGLLWAKCNVGATVPEGYGDYFAWGETQPKSDYSWSTYQYCTVNGDGGLATLTKYNTSSTYGTVDNMTVLESGDDAATANMGNGACTPTKENWEELLNNTRAEWTTLNGVYGRRFTATNGNSIFLPATGYHKDSDSYFLGEYGFYSSASLSAENPSYIWDFYFFSDNQEVVSYYNSRCTGLSVRAVKSSK